MLQIPVSEYERNHLSRVSDDDTDHIWSLVSCFIQQQMLKGKGVYIFGLGTFTFCQQKLNLGNKHLLIERPVFILTEKLSQHYGFKQNKPQATDASVGPLNFSALSAKGPFQRDVVERCVRGTLLLLLRAAATIPSVSHTFPGIGVLTFRHSRVKMLFSPDFISALDASRKPFSASASRAESRISGDPERSCNVQRPTTSSAATLPKISAGGPLRKQPQTDKDDSDGWAAEKRQQTVRASVSETDLPDGLKDRCPANTDRNVSEPAGGALSITTEMSLDRVCGDHGRAGQACGFVSQELCYVCMQRAQRNLPLYRSDESRGEREQERVLMLREHQRDLQYFQKEEMDRLKKREDGQKLAMFNLAVAEAQRRRKAQASVQSDMLGADGRGRTQTDADGRTAAVLWMALERSQQLREKHKMAEEYQKALIVQTTLHCSEISPRLDAWPVFGRMDSSPAALAEQRQRAQKISEELMNTANQRRREKLEKRLNQQKREREMMQRDQAEMIAERMRRCEKLRLLQAVFKESWQYNTDLKHQRDQEELSRRRFGGQTLTEQLRKYERCGQCKRSTTNRGESNIFRDTNFVTGARLML
ncbi:coiled-coil domain-containing protein 81-like [Puntigrus tetrazona]|uniref:coiled-coil domain-containing protein 81-like n=1 Tax=Puntigrus tetrazona TaxID=1606681 RepID=UPI001C8A6431|nr:coiled-coil domain-containing protein 81-like [Puntigrus tetrazona]